LSILKRAFLILFVILPLAHADNEAWTPDPVTTPLPAASNWSEVVDRYVLANRAQQGLLRDSTMDVEILGKLPQLKKEATLRGVRQVAESGQISYETLTALGDTTVKRDVIAKYLTAEQEASVSLVKGDGKLQSIAITPDNYKFQYKGLEKLNDRGAYVFQVTPKQKRLGLFKGEVWVDVETFQTLRESGIFVKNPHIFVRKVQFVRDYETQNGVAVPVRIVSKIDTRGLGKAELDVRYSNFSTLVATEGRVCPLGF
jgi:hypothetical protein